MSNLDFKGDGGAANVAENHSTLFAHLVLQQSNLAMMLLGKLSHPETGEVVKDLDAAKLFIDQLAMLEAKTKGNLTKEESALLRQTLTSLQLAFVASVDSGKAAGQAATSNGSKAEVPGASTAPPPASEEEGRKKFSKKY